ncbi:MAG: ATP-binding protein [Pseudomonadota bacterium]|jgi:two-component system sensor kinase FixL
MPGINDLHRVLDAALDAVVVFDHAGCILFANKATERLFGWSAADLHGTGILRLLPEVESLLQQRTDVNQEAQALHRDGTVIPVRVAIGRVAGSGAPRHVAFLHDLSERKEEEERTRLMNERLMNVARLATMGEMAGGIAHELNQPLTAIANYALAAERLLDSPDSDLEDVHVALREIVAEAMRAGEIIRRLRSLARSDDNAPCEVTSVGEFIEELRAICLADARAHRARLSFELQPDLPPLLVHRMQIAQVLLNLLRNALEALADEPPEARLVTVTCRRTPEGDCEIAVRDNGPGVSETILERLFEPFRSTKPNGVGLGLPMCRTIAEAHGGSLRHEPASPRGARFVLTLPAAEVTS